MGETRILKAFGSNIQEFQPSLHQCVFHLTLLRVTETAIYISSLDTHGLQLVHLVFHQRDERANNNRCPFEHQARNLIA